jgi:hypothetical protein
MEPLEERCSAHRGWVIVARKGSREDLVANKPDLFAFNPVTRHALEQAHHAVDAYFDILKEMVSAFPSGGTQIGERMKEEGVENITAVQALVKRLSEAKDFQEALAVQTAFIHSQLNVFAKRVESVSEAPTSAAQDTTKKISRSPSLVSRPQDTK